MRWLATCNNQPQKTKGIIIIIVPSRVIRDKPRTKEISIIVPSRVIVTV